jgi:bacterioferritin-associated ferredoxin
MQRPMVHRPDGWCTTRFRAPHCGARVFGGVIEIDRCVCKQTRFADLLPQARERGWDLASLISATGCGAQCGLCRPYLAAMLRDDVTVFHTILPPLDHPGSAH